MGSGKIVVIIIKYYINIYFLRFYIYDFVSLDIIKFPFVFGIRLIKYILFGHFIVWTWIA